MTATVGIIGAGTAGQQIARYLLGSGHGVILSNSKGPETLSDLIAELGPAARAATAKEAAAADIVVLAVPWSTVESVLAAVPAWDGRILIDATNAIRAYNPPVIELYDFDDETSSEVVERLAPGARVVKAFNTRSYPLPAVPADAPGEKNVFFYCGDDADAKDQVRGILDGIGLAPLDLGTLGAGSRMQQIGGPLAGVSLRLAHD
jgi:hypothetical protein